MNQEQFEDHIKKSFDTHQVPLDTNELWSAIETDLPAEKKRRPFFFWLPFGLSGLILLGTIAFYQYDRFSNEHTQAIDQVNNNLVEHTSTTTQQPTTLNTAFTENKINTKTQTITPVLSKPTTINTSNSNTKHTTKKDITNTIQENSSFLYTSEKENPLPNQKRPTLSTELSTSVETSIKTEKVLPESPKINRFENLDVLPIHWVDLDNHVTTRPTPIPPSFPTWRLFTVLQGGTTFVNKTIQTNTNGVQNYTDLRKNTETPILSYQFSGLVGLQHQKTHWYIKTGLQYQQLNDIFDYKQETQRILYSLTGSDNQTELTTRTIRHYNQIQLLEIPVLIGKTFRNRHRISLDIEAGVATSLSLQANGRFIDEQMELGVLDKTMFRQQNWSVLAAIGGAYQLNPKTALTLGIAYQQYLSSLKVRKALTTDQYGLLNIRLGIKQVF